MFSYPYSTTEEKFNNLINIHRQNFSTLNKTQSIFYSNVIGDYREIDVTSDYIFKGIFSDESRTRDFLENILIGNNKIFPEGTKIQEMEYLKNEYIQTKLPEEAKKIIFDLQIKTQQGIFIIEMQKNATPDYLKRVEFYNAIAYSNQDIKDKGDVTKNGKTTKYPMKDYESAHPIITISVIKDKLFDDKVPCVSYHTNTEKETGKQYMNAFSYVFIELDKFDVNNYNKSIISDNEKDWLTFMKTQDINKTYKNEQVNSAVKYVDNIKTNKYEEYLRHQMSEMAAMKEIESAEQKGRKDEKIEIARNLLSMKLDVDTISRATGLKNEEIALLKKKK
jgi:predicted transposase/invertase (TIGR01784 family)